MSLPCSGLRRQRNPASWLSLRLVMPFCSHQLSLASEQCLMNMQGYDCNCQLTCCFRDGHDGLGVGRVWQADGIRLEGIWHLGLQ